jgi:hypothetical protein
VDKNHYYLIDKALKFITGRTKSTNEGFANLIMRHGKPQMNRSVRG